MKKSQQSAAEIEEMELTEANRRGKRNKAFQTMKIRDRGWVNLSNGVRMEWPVNAELKDWELRKRVPKGFFILNINGKDILFDAEEFRKWIRWV